jgi:hypothetical protein
VSGEDRDLELTRTLSQIRRDDERSAPGFREVLSRARGAPSAANPSRIFRVVAMAALILIGAAVVFIRRSAPEPALPASVFEIARWKAPTDSLLTAAGEPIAFSVPNFALRFPDYSRRIGIEPAQSPNAATQK